MAVMVEFYCPTCRNVSALGLKYMLIRPGLVDFMCPDCKKMHRMDFVYNDYPLPHPPASDSRPEGTRKDERTVDGRSDEQIEGE